MAEQQAIDLSKVQWDEPASATTQPSVDLSKVEWDKPEQAQDSTKTMLTPDGQAPSWQSMLPDAAPGLVVPANTPVPNLRQTAPEKPDSQPQFDKADLDQISKWETARASFLHEYKQVQGTLNQPMIPAEEIIAEDGATQLAPLTPFQKQIRAFQRGDKFYNPKSGKLAEQAEYYSTEREQKQMVFAETTEQDLLGSTAAAFIKFSPETIRAVGNLGFLSTSMAQASGEFPWIRGAQEKWNRMFDRLNQAVLPPTVTEQGGVQKLDVTGLGYGGTVRFAVKNMTDSGNVMFDPHDPDTNPWWTGPAMTGVQLVPDIMALVLAGKGVDKLAAKIFGSVKGATEAETAVKAGTTARNVMTGVLSARQISEFRQSMLGVLQGAGVDPDKASAQADGLALAYAPVSVFLNSKYAPLALGRDLNSALSKAQSPWNHMLASSFLQGMIGSADTGAKDFIYWLRHFNNDDAATITDAKQIVGDMGRAFFHGAVTGSVVHVMETMLGREPVLKAKFGVEEFLNSYGKSIDAWSRTDLMRQGIQEFHGDEHGTRDVVNLQSGLVQQYAKNRDIHPEVAWGEVFANKAEREDATNLVLYQKRDGLANMFWKAQNLIDGDEFKTVVGEKGAPAQQVLGWLRNKLSTEELKWSGLGGFLEEKAETKEGGKVQKVTDDELAQAFKDRHILIASQHLPEHDLESLAMYWDQHDVYVENYRKAREEMGKYQEQDPPDPRRVQAQTDMYHWARLQEINRGEIAKIQAGGDSQYKNVVAPGPAEKYEEWLISTPKHVFEQVRQVMDDGGLEARQDLPEYTAPHFGEEGADLLMHIRADQRQVELEDGSKVPALMVLEAQSDRQQLARAFEKQGEIAAKINEKTKQIGPDISEEQLKKLSGELKVLAQQGTDLVQQTKGKDEPPEAPWKKDWPELAAKYSLVQAVQRGMRVISIPSGAVNTTYEGAMSERAKAGREYFYDEILPKVFEKVLKKVDPKAKLEQGSVPLVQLPVLEKPEQKRLFIHKVENGFQVKIGTERLGHPDVLAVDNISTREEAQQVIEELKQVQPWHTGKVKLLRISDQAAKQISNIGFSYFQQNRAATFMLNNGRLFYKALQNPDLGSLLHEMMHGLRLSLMPSSDIAQLDKLYNVQNGQWSTENHEQFVKDALTYLSENHAPTPQLVGAFERVSDYLKQLYKGAQFSEIDSKINPEFRALMDRQFVLDLDPVQARRGIIEVLQNKLALTQKKLIELNKPDADLEPSEIETRAMLAGSLQDQVTELGQRLDEASKDLLKVQQSFYRPGEETLPEKRWKELEGAEDLKLENNQAFRGLSQYDSVRSVTRGVYSKIKGLGDLPIVHRLEQMLDDTVVDMKMYRGPMDLLFREVLQNIPKDDRAAITQGKERFRDEKGGAYDGGMKLMLDQKAIPASDRLEIPERLKPLTNSAVAVRLIESEKMKELDTLRHLPSGASVPFDESVAMTMPRLPTPEGHDLLQNLNTPKARRYVEIHAKAYNITMKQAEEMIRGVGEDVSKNRTYGFIEGSRTAKNLFDSFDFEGQRVQVFHTDPVEIMMLWGEKSARRLATIKWFGQGVLKDVAELKGPMKDLLGVFEVPIRQDLEALKSKLRGGNVPEEYVNGVNNKKTAAKTAEQFGVDLDLSAKDLLGAVHTLDWRDLSTLEDPRNKVAQLVAIGNKLGGVNTTGHVAEVLNSIKWRLTEHVEDQVWDKVSRLYQEAGGNPKDIDWLRRDFQGYPRKLWEENALNRSVYAATSILNSAKVSLSPTLNAFQTLATVPEHYGLNFFKGGAELLGAYSKMFTHWQDQRDGFILMGALRANVLAGMADSSYLSMRVARGVKESTRQLGHMQTEEFNQVVSAIVAKRQVESWIKDGVTPGGLRLAKMEGRLTDSEVNELKSGTVSLRTQAKYIQNFVARTQYGPEESFRRSELELNPWAKVLLPFRSYGLGMGRQFGDALALTRDGASDAVASLRTGVKTGDPGKFLTGASYLLSMITWIGGVGMLQNAARKAVQGRPIEDDDSWWLKVAKATTDMQTFGFFSQLASPVVGGWAPDHFLMAQSPTLNTVEQLIGTMLGYGRWGEFSGAKRIEEFMFAQTPAAQAMRRQLRYLVWPDAKQYDELRYKSSQWIKKQPDQMNKSTGVDPIKPEYFYVYDAIVRGDLQEATQRSVKYLQDQVKEGKDPFKAREALRASLMERRPINLSKDPSDPRFWRFMGSLPRDQRQKAIQVNSRYEASVNMVAPGSG